MFFESVLVTIYFMLFSIQIDWISAEKIRSILLGCVKCMADGYRCQFEMGRSNFTSFGNRWLDFGTLKHAGLNSETT